MDCPKLRSDGNRLCGSVPSSGTRHPVNASSGEQRALKQMAATSRDAVAAWRDHGLHVIDLHGRDWAWRLAQFQARCRQLKNSPSQLPSTPLMPRPKHSSHGNRRSNQNHSNPEPILDAWHQGPRLVWSDDTDAAILEWCRHHDGLIAAYLSRLAQQSSDSSHSPKLPFPTSRFFRRVSGDCSSMRFLNGKHRGLGLNTFS